MIYPSQVQTSKTSPSKKKQKTCLATPVTQKVIVIDDDNFQCSPQTSTSWLTLNRCTLTSLDEEEIMIGKMLTDKHINFTQEIFKNQFTFLSGLECTLTFGKQPFDKINNDKHFL